MDISLQECGDGGEIILINSDVATTDSLFNQVYLALFGGNVAQTTREAETIDGNAPTERRDFWANSLLFKDDQQSQFNSLTEKELLNNTLSSSGRSKIRAAIQKDLEFMLELSTIDVQVIFEDTARAKITVTFTELEGLSDRNFVFLWDGTRNEIIIENKVGFSPPQFLITQGGENVITQGGEMIEL